MALLHPEMSQIEKFVPHPEAGELALIRFLAEHLDDTFEVFFQPMLDGDRPDVVILKENYGAVIWEVKDWLLEHYEFTPSGECHLRRNGTVLESPIDQVVGYKKRLLNLYIPDLVVELATNSKLFGMVRTALYFHHATTSQVRASLGGSKEPTQLYGSDALRANVLPQLLHDLRLSSPSPLFDAAMFRRFLRFLAPPLHTQEMGKPLTYTAQQQELITSRPEQKKIAGVAGSGKTYVLAKRAVNAYIRTQRQVLILTFNICVKNYIHDRISEVREDFRWDSFVIASYHQFFVTQAHHHNLPIKEAESDRLGPSFEDEDFFEGVKNRIARYPAIFVDEVQDFPVAWLRILKKYFLAEDGEYVLFGDAKQNLYGRPLDNRAIRTNIPGPFAQLLQTQRLNQAIASLATKFQARFMSDRYEIEVIHSVRQLDLFQSELVYCQAVDNSATALVSLVWGYVEKWGAHPNDVTVLCPTNEVVRDLDAAIQHLKHERTTISCESEDEYRKLKASVDTPKREMELAKIRRHRRHNFWQNAGTVKISTIHSFKGLESGAIFVVLLGLQGEEAAEEGIYTAITRCRNQLAEEGIYTAITRCRNQLVVIGNGASKYDPFFRLELNQTT